MAAGRHNLTRRALLGAAFAAPAVLGDCAAPAGRPPQRWDRALAALERAKAAEHAFRDGPMAAAERAWEAVHARWPRDYDFAADPAAETALRAAFAGHGRWEARLNDLEAAHQRAIQRLLLVPAPDPPALAAKIALAVDREVWECEDGERCMATLKEDGWRLADAARRKRERSGTWWAC